MTATGPGRRSVHPADLHPYLMTIVIALGAVHPLLDGHVVAAGIIGVAAVIGGMATALYGANQRRRGQREGVRTFLEEIARAGHERNAREHP